MLLLGCDGTLQKPPEPRAKRLVSGSLGLVGRTSTTCSHATGSTASADTWCAYYRATEDATELWVLNVSRAMTETIACDGSSPHCRRLTTNLWTGDPLVSQSHPTIHGFEGDTLFIYSDALTMRHDDSYRGPIKAWRPGWAEARVISTPDGYLCHGSASAPVAYCLDRVVEANRNFELDVLAGSLAGGSTGPLASTGRIRALGSAGQLMWGATFSPDGQHLLLSSPADGEDVEVLRAGRVMAGATAPLTEIARGVGRWRIAPDGKKLYFLEDFNYMPNEPSGTLSMADFPAMTNRTTLQARVGLYAPLGLPGEPDRGLGYLREVARGGGTFGILRDRSRPAQALTLESAVTEFTLSPDLRHSFLSKSDENGEVALLASTDGAGACALNTRENVPVYSVVFSPDSGKVYWAQDAEQGFDIEGWYAGTDGCSDRRLFSSNLAFVSPVRGGLLWADSDPDHQTMTLKYAKLTNGLLPDAGLVPVHARIDVTIARAPRYAVFTVSRGDEDEVGLYAFGPLP
jgi:hypothetical protein